MTHRELRHLLTDMLLPVVGDGEARDMTRIIYEEITGYDRVKVLLHDDRQIMDETAQRMISVAKRVIDGEPLQYALGTARFHGRDFCVTPDTLIPRPETSQLCDLIIDQYGSRTDLRVLDIGTGSGAIAITLALDLPFSQVTAIDISPAALAVAAGNAQRLHAKVSFAEANAFSIQRDEIPSLKHKFDIIVSNPPYVLNSERESMDPRVTLHEPQIALFVDDAHPIDIYSAITAYAVAHLNPGGSLFFEINPLCADRIIRMMQDCGLFDPSLHRDFRGALRFASARAIDR